MNIHIHALFTLFEGNYPEILDAWDENQIDGHPEGWKEVKERAEKLAEENPSYHELREIVLVVPAEDIKARFEVAEVQTEVSDP